jgi:hypothetical integral membrane protein (TIGR02206 family)
MIEYFVKDYIGEPFHFLGLPHLVVLGVIMAINVALVCFRKSFDHRSRLYLRYSLAILLLSNEAGWHLWNWLTGQWTIQKMLPLHLSSLMVYLSAISLITNSARWYHLIYFLGIGSAIQPLLTPDITIYGFPHYRVFQTFITHGGILTTGCYIIFIEKYSPSWKSMLRAFIEVILYMGCVGMVNAWIGSNYLFLAHKPSTPTIMDILGPWPWYILGIVGIGIISFLLLYAPFAIKAWKQARCNVRGLQDEHISQDYNIR